jgi:hypothetical protein
MVFLFPRCWLTEKADSTVVTVIAFQFIGITRLTISFLHKIIAVFRSFLQKFVPEMVNTITFAIVIGRKCSKIAL